MQDVLHKNFTVLSGLQFVPDQDVATPTRLCNTLDRITMSHATASSRVNASQSPSTDNIGFYRSQIDSAARTAARYLICPNLMSWCRVVIVQGSEISLLSFCIAGEAIHGRPDVLPEPCAFYPAFLCIVGIAFIEYSESGGGGQAFGFLRFRRSNFSVGAGAL